MDKTQKSQEAAMREEYTPRVKEMTLEQLPAFISELMDRKHDYGSICVAMGLIAAASAWACNKHEQGGITGFQAGAVFWEFARAWGSPSIGKIGARFLNYDDLLFPQYAEKFTAISADTWAAVQEQAREKIAAEQNAHPDVVAHWRSIADGQVPFGLSITA